MLKIELREGHKYFINGKRAPGVNEILNSGGFTDFSKVNAEILDCARDFGHKVHRAIALFTAKNLNQEILADELRPYLEAWKKWVSMTGFKPLCCEESMYSRQWGFAGTPDQPGMIGRKYVLPDYKSSAMLSPVVALQLAGYEILMRERFKIKDSQKIERIAVKLCSDGMPRPKIYNSFSDRGVFLGALNGFKWKKVNGLLKEAE